MTVVPSGENAAECATTGRLHAAPREHRLDHLGKPDETTTGSMNRSWQKAISSSQPGPQRDAGAQHGERLVERRVDVLELERDHLVQGHRPVRQRPLGLQPDRGRMLRDEQVERVVVGQGAVEVEQQEHAAERSRRRVDGRRCAAGAPVRGGRSEAPQTATGPIRQLSCATEAQAVPVDADPAGRRTRPARAQPRDVQRHLARRLGVVDQAARRMPARRTPRGRLGAQRGKVVVRGAAVALQPEREHPQRPLVRDPRRHRLAATQPCSNAASASPIVTPRAPPAARWRAAATRGRGRSRAGRRASSDRTACAPAGPQTIRVSVISSVP